MLGAKAGPVLLTKGCLFQPTSLVSVLSRGSISEFNSPLDPCPSPCQTLDSSAMSGSSEREIQGWIFKSAEFSMRRGVAFTVVLKGLGWGGVFASENLAHYSCVLPAH